MEVHVSRKTRRDYELESKIGTVMWVQECCNYTKLLFNMLGDFQVSGNEMADWQEEYASNYLRFQVKSWVCNVGSEMWSDMTHFEIAGIMYPTSTYKNGEKELIYDLNDAKAWCSCADRDPERIAALWQSKGAITKDVWKNAVRT